MGFFPVFLATQTGARIIRENQQRINSNNIRIQREQEEKRKKEQKETNK